MRTSPPLLFVVILASLFFAGCASRPVIPVQAPLAEPPATHDYSGSSQEVTFQSKGVTLHGFIHKPIGSGPFPAILYNHGSEPRPGDKARLGAWLARHGYVVFVPHRPGQGSSPGQYVMTLVEDAPKGEGPKVALDTLLDQVEDLENAMSFLRSQPYVDANRIAVAGCSFGGIETLLLAERQVGLKAAVDFAGAAMSWKGSPLLRDRLREAVRHSTVPIFFLQAMNDFTTEPSQELSWEMDQAGKPHRIKIFTPHGVEPMEGHAGFCFKGAPEWGGDVLDFLNETMPPPQPKAPAAK
jgi:dienelactone hydrolase